MANGTTAYDEVQYPSTLHPATHPARLAALARLHGLDAPDPAKARVLEVAGGDGLNVIAMAAVYPEAQFLSFDLSSSAVARGRALAQAAGLDNVRIEQGDVVDAADGLDGEFDYVIVNGLYAWVPEPVRAATLKLIGGVLSPEGIAFLSYNTTPGGYLRLAVREMLLREREQGLDAQDEMRRVRAFLADFVVPRDDDDPARASLRYAARPIMEKPDGFLFHDELGDCFEPQALTEVARAAAPHGLSLLGDAMPALVFNGLPGSDLDEEEALRFAQTEDYMDCAFFHRSLFVRSGRGPLRRIDPACFAGLYGAARVRRTGPQTLMSGDKEIEIDDDRLCDFLELLGRSAPAWVPLDEFAGSQAHCEALVQLYQRGIVDLYATPYPGGSEPGDRPRASGLVRAQIAAGIVGLSAIEHRAIAVADHAPRAFLALLDGTRSRDQLVADWVASGFSDQIGAEDALRQLWAAGLVLG
jgi:SAM-dependent methyltransferase